MHIINHNLSVIIFSYGLINDVTSYNDTPRNLLIYSKKKFANCEKLTRAEISKNTTFGEKEIDIIKKSLKLANYVKEKELIELSEINIEILSLNDLNAIGDIKLNSKIIDIKLNSIHQDSLEISKFLFLLTKSNKYKNKNLFEYFAKEELNNTFRKGCEILMEELSNNSYQSKLTKVSYSRSIDKLYFFYQGEEFYINDFSNITYDNFFYTIPNTFLKVFSNCFDKLVIHNTEYLNQKKNCFISVKEEIDKIIMNKVENTSLNNLLFSLFKLSTDEYYSISLSNEYITCYEIPSRNKFNLKFDVSSIFINIEDGLFYIKIFIVNKKTSKILELRNVFNYQNGEFYTSPEIKSDINEDLISNIYNKK